MVAGVNPKKAGQMHLDLPIFKSVRDAAESTGARRHTLAKRLLGGTARAEFGLFH